jgi:acyl CoA:acetate/3-ketoacid CoA transferase
MVGDHKWIPTVCLDQEWSDYISRQQPMELSTVKEVEIGTFFSIGVSTLGYRSIVRSVIKSRSAISEGTNYSEEKS